MSYQLTFFSNSKILKRYINYKDLFNMYVFNQNKVHTELEKYCFFFFLNYLVISMATCHYVLEPEFLKKRFRFRSNPFGFWVK